MALTEWLAGTETPKLAKLRRQHDSRRKALSEILCNLDQFSNDDLDRAWDKEAKAGDELASEQNRIVKASGIKWAMA